MLTNNFKVQSPAVQYEETAITTEYIYRNADARVENNNVIITPKDTKYTFRTVTKVPRLGVMIVGLGGNNGTTVIAGCVANKEGITWRTKNGVQQPNYFGSITQSSTISLGVDPTTGEEVYVPLKSMVPMVDPNDIVFGGWDINGSNLADAMERAQVLDWDLQRQLIPHMKDIKPLPGIYIPDFIAANQKDRADNILKGTKQELVEKIRQDIRNFKDANKLDKIVVLWSANTERFADIVEGVNDTAENLMAAIKRNEEEISPSSLYAVASILEG